VQQESAGGEMTDPFLDAYKTAVETAIRKEIAGLVDAAVAGIREKLTKRVDDLALMVLANYDVMRDGKTLTITVRKP
jgi:hypothetical protein